MRRLRRPSKGRCLKSQLCRCKTSKCSGWLRLICFSFSLGRRRWTTARLSRTCSEPRTWIFNRGIFNTIKLCTSTKPLTRALNSKKSWHSVLTITSTRTTIPAIKSTCSRYGTWSHSSRKPTSTKTSQAAQFGQSRTLTWSRSTVAEAMTSANHSKCRSWLITSRITKKKSLLSASAKTQHSLL